MEKGKWIWYQGDFEIYHSMLLHSRREHYGHTYPCFWSISTPYTRVNFHKEFEAGEDTVINVKATAAAYVKLDGKGYGDNEDIFVSKGKHNIKIALMKIGGLPSVYIDSKWLKTDESWLADNGAAAALARVGATPCYSDPNVTPEEFVFSYKKVEWQSKAQLNGGILYDFGKELFGKLIIKNAACDDELYITYGESKEEALDREWAVIRDTVKGKAEYSLKSRAFRYIFIKSDRCNDLEIFAEYEYLPLEDKGFFECDNEKINNVWRVSAYTLNLNSREFYLDGIKRDRWVWSGDACQSFMINRYLHFDNEIIKRTITALVGRPPYEQHINTINDYTLYMIIGLWEYYFSSGDKKFVEFIYPRIKALYDFTLSRLDENGLMCEREGDWIFVDWAEMDKEGPVCALQILLWRATLAMADLSRLLGEEGDGYERSAQKLKETILRLYWNDEKGAFIDSFTSGKNNVTRHANIFAILYDFADNDKKQIIKSRVLDNPEIPPITTPYFNFYQLMASCEMGNIESMQKAVEDYWGGMIKQGATTIWEEFDPNLTGIEHYGMYGKRFEKSLCHAWGSGPIFLLGRYCLGVIPKDIAYKSFEVKPVLGAYKHIKGSVPLPDGKVDIEYDGATLKVFSTADGGYYMKGEEKILIPKNEEKKICH